MRGKLGSTFEVAHDGTAVRFGLGYGNTKPVTFDLETASLTDSPSLSSDFAPAQVDGLPVTDWKGSIAPKFNGTTLFMHGYDRSEALAIRPGASGFVLGAEFSVRAFDANGEQLWSWNHLGRGALGVDFPADGETVVVAHYGEGTIRWLRWKDGEELLALFVDPQTRKWVAWTPSGYYMASAGGEDLIGWQVNQGWTEESNFFGASQFRARYNRPDIVRLVLETRDEDEAVRRANAALLLPVKANPVSAALPPVIEIVSPADGSHFASESVEIGYAVRPRSGSAIDRVDVLVNGQPVHATGFVKTISKASGNLAVTLPRKDTAVSLIAYSGDLTSAPVSIMLRYVPSASSGVADLLKPRLYALLIGVTGYQNPDYDNIHFGAHDADELAKALMTQKGGLYADVEAKIVDDPGRSDADPTRSNVEEGLYWLQHEATNRDLSVIFLSGHGFLDAKQKFWFLTREADIDRLRTTAISNDDLLDLIDSIPGKKVLFIDACHSGAAMTVGYKSARSETTPDMNKVVNDFSTAGSGVVVFAASTGTEIAREDEKWDRHGAFAKALIEAIGEGKASLDPRKPITTDLLDYYIVERVKELTNGKQHPVMHRPDLVPDFPLAVATP